MKRYIAPCVRQLNRSSATAARHGVVDRLLLTRHLHSSRRLQVVKPFLLADIGEGIRECQVIQWFVKPGARVEQFDKLCEVQSDKASVEITSRFDGVIKKLYYEADDMAIVGKPLVDIDIQSEISAEDEALTKPPAEESEETKSKEEPNQEPNQEPKETDTKASSEPESTPQDAPRQASKPSGKHAALATPAVRHLTKELDVEITDVTGTGKDGRVLKEDVHRFAAERKDSGSAQPGSKPAAPTAADRTVPLTPIQSQMFKAMTRSLAIPHFLYTDPIDFSALTALRARLNARNPTTKLSALAFALKATSLALNEYPILNARLDTTTNPSKPQLVLRAAHNLGIAVDSPQGLVVPVVKGVQTLSIAAIAAEVARLAGLAKQGKLSAADMSGATFTVSNIGSIGGAAVAPVISEGQVAIVGMGRARRVPAFDEEGNVVAREECVFSWSADHRVVDGATAARCADVVRRYLEAPEEMLVQLQ